MADRAADVPVVTSTPDDPGIYAPDNTALNCRFYIDCSEERWGWRNTLPHSSIRQQVHIGNDLYSKYSAKLQASGLGRFRTNNSAPFINSPCHCLHTIRRRTSRLSIRRYPIS